MANQMYYTGPASPAGDFWNALVTTNPGDTPDSASGKWSRIAIPSIFRRVLSKLTHAGCLELDGQTDKAIAKRAEGETLLDDLVRENCEREVRANRGTGTVRNLVPRQSVPAGTILEDVYRAMRWVGGPNDTQTVPDDGQIADARSSLSQALQQVWEAWWWEALCDCAQTQFAPTYTGTQNICYWPLTDWYYFKVGTAATNRATDAVPLEGDNFIPDLQPAANTTYPLGIGPAYEPISGPISNFVYTGAGAPLPGIHYTVDLNAGTVSILDFDGSGNGYWAVSGFNFACAFNYGASTLPPTDPSGNLNYTIWAKYQPVDRPQLWDPNTQYAGGDQRTYNGVLYALTVAQNTGSQPDVSPNIWASVPDWNPTLPYDDGTGNLVGPFGAVRGASRLDPRVFEHPEPYELVITPDGTQVRLRAWHHECRGIGRPWVRTRRATPILTGNPFDTSASYTAAPPADGGSTPPPSPTGGYQVIIGPDTVNLSVLTTYFNQRVGGPYTVVLPNGTALGQQHQLFVFSQNHANTATFNVTGSFTGFSTLVFDTLGWSALLQWDGTGWQMIGGNALPQP